MGKSIKPSVEVAEELRKSHGVDEVQLIDQQGFRDYYKEALDLKKAQELTGYDFKERTRQLKNTQGNGLIIHPHRESYDYFHHYIGPKPQVRGPKTEAGLRPSLGSLYGSMRLVDIISCGF